MGILPLRPIATMILISNGHSGITRARCYCHLLFITLISGPKQDGIDIDVFKTIDGGHVEALGTWGQCMGCN
jgi:hypothetical protein